MPAGPARRARQRGIARRRKVGCALAPGGAQPYHPHGLRQRAIDIVADRGAARSHAAIVAREYGIPAGMGTPDGVAPPCRRGARPRGRHPGPGLPHSLACDAGSPCVRALMLAPPAAPACPRVIRRRDASRTDLRGRLGDRPGRLAGRSSGPDPITAFRACPCLGGSGVIAASGRP